MNLVRSTAITVALLCALGCDIREGGLPDGGTLGADRSVARADAGGECVPDALRACYTFDAGIPGVGRCSGGTNVCQEDGYYSPICFGEVGPIAERCNGQDDDCDGVPDDDLPPVSCGTGACQRTAESCVNGAPRGCTPGLPAGEECNGVDDDCNGVVDDGLGTVSCGAGACAITLPACENGVPRACFPGDGGLESCNGADDDCNGIVDDGLGTLSCGRGACARMVAACENGAAQTCVPFDAGVEECNGVDDDCDGAVDDGAYAALCPLPERATSAYCAGGCVVGDCQSGHYDLDRSFANGCECSEDADAGPSCERAFGLGPLLPGQTARYDGRTVEGGASDWFQVDFPNLTADGGVAIHFEANENGDYVFEVRTGCDAAPLCAEQLRSASFGRFGSQLGVTGSPSCNLDSAAHPSLHVRVLRTSSSPWCGGYRLGVKRH